MNRKTLLAALGAALLFPALASAQATAKRVAPRAASRRVRRERKRAGPSISQDYTEFEVLVSGFLAEIRHS